MTFDPLPYAEGIMKLNKAEAEEIRVKAALARDEARRLAEAIRTQDSEVKSIILFGSLARQEPWRVDFDIDLAIDGGDIYKAMDAVEGSPFRVDLVDLRLVQDDMASRIREYGVRL